MPSADRGGRRDQRFTAHERGTGRQYRSSCPARSSATTNGKACSRPPSRWPRRRIWWSQAAVLLSACRMTSMRALRRRSIRSGSPGARQLGPGAGVTLARAHASGPAEHERNRRACGRAAGLAGGAGRLGQRADCAGPQRHRGRDPRRRGRPSGDPGSTHAVRPPPMQVNSAIGAGDSFMGGMCAGLVRASR